MGVRGGIRGGSPRGDIGARGVPRGVLQGQRRSKKVRGGGPRVDHGNY